MNEKTETNQRLEKILGVLNIPEKYACNGSTLFEQVSNSAEAYVQANLSRIDFSSPTIEGESKKIYRLGKLALIELKPTMYSYTHNRYGTVEQTDDLRLKFWKLFGTMLNTNASEHMLGDKRDPLITEEVEQMINPELPFISNYLGQVNHTGKEYALVRFADSIPPLEVVWKNYLVGTMKHNLKTVDRHRTKSGEPILYEGRLPKDIIRFDWRNPLPDKDECIPDDFADVYMNTKAAKKVARTASLMLNRMLQSKGYELVDLCYFMNYEGNCIHSEITPDGMRIRKKDKSFDKDLWRQGKDKEIIIKTWTQLYEDLKNG